MIENLRRLLESPPAPKRKQCVSDENEVLLLEIIGDVPAGVARNLDHAPLERSDGELVVLADEPVEAADLRASLAGPDTRARGKRALRPANALDMIGMVMGSRISVRVPFVLCERSEMGAASGASIAVVDRVSASWTRTPKLSVRQMNWWIWGSYRRVLARLLASDFARPDAT